jgi:hypothetical protein
MATTNGAHVPGSDLVSQALARSGSLKLATPSSLRSIALRQVVISVAG